MSVLLFAGDSYYPSGGWYDHVGSFRSVEKAQQRIDGTRVETSVPERVWTLPFPKPGQPGLAASTGSYTVDPAVRFAVGARVNRGVVIANDGETVTVKDPPRTDVSYEFDWAHIVHNGRVIQWIQDADGTSHWES